MQQGNSLHRLALVASLALAVVSSAAPAQTADNQSGWHPFVSFTPLRLGTADLDGGGDFRTSGVILHVGMNRPFGNGHRAGLTFNYAYTDYRFASPAAFGNVTPWDDVERFGVNAPFVFRGANEWSYALIPSVDYFMEEGARSSEALAYGAVLAATKRFAPERQLGFGVAVFDRLEETNVLPVLLIDWKLTDRWRLGNPLAAGPTGGAGLELSYRLNGGWVLGAGGAYRSERFRLRDDGPFANGIGEQRGVAAFFHAARSIGGNFGLDLYAGAVLGGELRVENANGDDLVKEDFDPAPLIGITLSARF